MIGNKVKTSSSVKCNIRMNIPNECHVRTVYFWSILWRHGMLWPFFKWIGWLKQVKLLVMQFSISRPFPKLYQLLVRPWSLANSLLMLCAMPCNAHFPCAGAVCSTNVTTTRALLYLMFHAHFKTLLMRIINN